MRCDTLGPNEALLAQNDFCVSPITNRNEFDRVSPIIVGTSYHYYPPSSSPCLPRPFLCPTPPLSVRDNHTLLMSLRRRRRDANLLCSTNRGEHIGKRVRKLSHYLVVVGNGWPAAVLPP